MMKKLILLFLVSIVSAMAMDEKEKKAVYCDLCTIMQGTALESGDLVCFVDISAVDTQVTQGNSRLPILMRKNRKKPDHYLISTPQHRGDTLKILNKAAKEMKFSNIVSYEKPHAYISARFSRQRTPEDNNLNVQHPCMFGVSNDDATVDPADFVFHGTEQSESIPLQIDPVPMLTLSGPADQQSLRRQTTENSNSTPAPTDTEQQPLPDENEWTFATLLRKFYQAQMNCKRENQSCGIQ